MNFMMGFCSAMAEVIWVLRLLFCLSHLITNGWLDLIPSSPKYIQC